MSKKYFEEVEFSSEFTEQVEVLFIAAGFEERSYHSLRTINLKNLKFIVLFHFDSDIRENDIALETAVNIINESEFSGDLKKIAINYHIPHLIDESLQKIVSSLDIHTKITHIDISGFPLFAVCQVLRIIRVNCPTVEQKIIYTSASKYFPLEEECRKLMSKSTHSEIDYIPSGLSLEMAENLFLEPFSGYRSNESSSCLAVFCGYEVHRSAGVIDNLNPAKLLLIYGKPGNSDFDWRLDYSKQIHHRYEVTRNVAKETVNTRDIKKSLDILEDYYSYLYDDHDLSVSPVCSKMQAVASYLFWENNNEVQLVFPVPIGHSVSKRAIGIDSTYVVSLPPKSSLYRDTERL